MRASKAALALAAVFALTAQLSAHRLDEYLQAVRIGVEPERVDIELSLTPGVAVAGAIVDDIARDRARYLATLLEAIRVDVDGRPVRMRLVDATFADENSLRSGSGTIAVKLAAHLPPLSSGAHRLRFRNDHRPGISVYLANALVPESDRVAVTAQDRDGDQRELTIRYVLSGERQSSMPFWPLMSAAALLLTIAIGRPSRRLVIP